MVRDCRCTPLQVHEQALHADHSVKTHGVLSFGWHGFELQISACVVIPFTGVPHADAGCKMDRDRSLIPPSQVAEQSVHAVHEPHLPSTHSSQLWALHASTWDLTSSGHSAPLPVGATAMLRSLVLWPPPQEHVHALQACQSLHLQSVSAGHFSAKVQGLVSFKESAHGAPSALA